MKMVKHMLKFIENDSGILGLTLSQIGLVVASMVLIAAVFSFVFQNDWKKEAELENIASEFSTTVECMDSKFFENVELFVFPDKKYCYNVSISTEYISVASELNNGDEFLVRERFLVQIWPQKKDSTWIGTDELHKYLKDTFGNSGNFTDPVLNASVVKSYLATKFTNDAADLASNPLYVTTDKAVLVDKAIVYYNDGEKQGFTFVYQ